MLLSVLGVDRVESPPKSSVVGAVVPEMLRLKLERDVALAEEKRKAMQQKAKDSAFALPTQS